MKRTARMIASSALAMALSFVVGTSISRIWHRLGTNSSSSLQIEREELSSKQTPAYHTWDKDFDNNYYRVLGTAVVDYKVVEGEVAYGNLDSFGRATGCVASVTYELMTSGAQRERSDTSAITPSGWGHNSEVDIAMPDGSIYHGYFFNRSHLIAKSLGGDDELHNLITGTRTQNVGANVAGTEGGMAYCEGLVRAWLTQNQDGWVYYAATPVYEAQEPIARSVIVDIRSCDNTIDQRIEVFNAARGFQIDYATGTYQQVEDADVAAERIRGQLRITAREPEAEGSLETKLANPTGPASSEDGERKVIVTGSGKAYHHDETCSGLVNARSMEWVTVSEAEAMGRHACGICGG